MTLLQLVGCETNVPFQCNNIKTGYIGDKVMGEELDRTVNDTVTSQSCCLFVQRWPKMGKDRGVYYASAYNRVETNQPPQNLFINSMWYLV